MQGTQLSEKQDEVLNGQESIVLMLLLDMTCVNIKHFDRAKHGHFLNILADPPVKEASHLLNVLHIFELQTLHFREKGNRLAKLSNGEIQL